jgi:Ca-activated chloride channel family protein
VPGFAAGPVTGPAGRGPVGGPTGPGLGLGGAPGGGIGGGFGGGFGGIGGFSGGGGGFPGGGFPAATPPPALSRGGAEGARPAKVADIAKDIAKKPGDTGAARRGMEDDKLGKLQTELERVKKDLESRPRAADGSGVKADPKADRKAAADKPAAAEESKRELAERYLKSVKEARDNFANYDQARAWYANGQYKDAQVGKVGLDVAVCANNLRTQDRLSQTANRYVAGRNCLELGGLWIDEGFTADMKTVVVKAQSDAYFKILEKNPAMKDVYRLGNYLIYVTPSKTALIVDANDGKDKLADDEIAALFVAKKDEAKGAKPEPKAGKK